jgi:hypothetical protein
MINNHKDRAMCWVMGGRKVLKERVMRRNERRMKWRRRKHK